MEGTICLIAPFDSEDPRADQLYFLINQRVPMTPSQKIQVVAGGGLGNATITRIYREGVKSLGAEGYYYNLWKEHRFVPQMWNNCKKTADLVFNNGLVRDRPAREALVHRAVMKWQCTGEKRQQSLKDYHTSISKGKSGATVKKLWNAIEKGEDLQLS